MLNVFLCAILCSDCLRFSFMNMLQSELDEVKQMWNTHLIRYERSQAQVNGIPDELYYIPQLRGIPALLETIIIVNNFFFHNFRIQGPEV